jgi:hypothetical protein
MSVSEMFCDVGQDLERVSGVVVVDVKLDSTGRSEFPPKLASSNRAYSLQPKEVKNRSAGGEHAAQAGT